MEDQGEFIPAQSRGESIAQRIADDSGNLDDRRIAGAMAVAVVQPLQPVHIDERQYGRHAVALAPFDRQSDFVHQPAAIGQACQGVMIGKQAQFGDFGTRLPQRQPQPGQFIPCLFKGLRWKRGCFRGRCPAIAVQPKDINCSLFCTYAPQLVHKLISRIDKQPEYTLPEQVLGQIRPIDELLHCQEQMTPLMSATFQDPVQEGEFELSEQAPVVGIIMGSTSDWETMRHAAETLAALDIPHEVKVVSAHRTPDRLYDYAKSAVGRGLKAIIAGAGGAAHLPGMAASMTRLPVLGVPVESKALKGMDSLLSIVQMPAGIPVGTLAIGRAGAVNAALLSAAMLATTDDALAARLDDWRKNQTDQVAERPE